MALIHFNDDAKKLVQWTNMLTLEKIILEIDLRWYADGLKAVFKASQLSIPMVLETYDIHYMLTILNEISGMFNFKIYMRLYNDY